jgi:hypothetical protein
MAKSDAPDAHKVFAQLFGRLYQKMQGKLRNQAMEAQFERRGSKTRSHPHFDWLKQLVELPRGDKAKQLVKPPRGDKAKHVHFKLTSEGKHYVKSLLGRIEGGRNVYAKPRYRLFPKLERVRMPKEPGKERRIVGEIFAANLTSDKKSPHSSQYRVLVTQKQNNAILSSYFYSIIKQDKLGKSLHKKSFAYPLVPHRGKIKHPVVRAIKEIDRNLGIKSTQYVLKIDIDRFFETIDHGIIYSVFERQMVKHKLTMSRRKIYRRLLQELLDSVANGYKRYLFDLKTEKDKSWKDRQEINKGILQGSPVSGFLANLYLDGLDQFLDSYALDSSTNRLKFVRYADDLMVFVPKRHKALLLNIQNDIVGYLRDKLLLKVNLNKCRAIDVDNGFDALGIRFTRSKGKTELRIARSKMLQIKEALKNIFRESSKQSNSNVGRLIRKLNYRIGYLPERSNILSDRSNDVVARRRRGRITNRGTVYYYSQLPNNSGIAKDMVDLDRFVRDRLRSFYYFKDQQINMTRFHDKNLRKKSKAHFNNLGLRSYVRCFWSHKAIQNKS